MSNESKINRLPTFISRGFFFLIIHFFFLLVTIVWLSLKIMAEHILFSTLRCTWSLTRHLAWWLTLVACCVSLVAGRWINEIKLTEAAWLTVRTKQAQAHVCGLETRRARGHVRARARTHKHTGMKITSRTRQVAFIGRQLSCVSTTWVCARLRGERVNAWSCHTKTHVGQVRQVTAHTWNFSRDRCWVWLGVLCVIAHH